MATKIILRRDTAANWASANTVLADGEMGYDTTNDRIKIGDGTTAWTLLPFATNVSLASGATDGLMSASNYTELTGATASNTASKIVKRDASGDFSARLITSTGTPSAATHLVTKQYVDGLISGLDVKQNVRVASTANLDLDGLDTVDGVVLVAGDRVLAKDQTTASENGVYIASSSAWTRAADCDENSEVTAGLFVFVSEGTVNADSGWVLTTNDVITVGTTGLSFSQFSGAGQITAGTALTKSGNTLNVQLTDATNSTSTSTAATPNSVKLAYDTAASKAKVTRAATAPISPSGGDIWIESDNGDVGYVYDAASSSWITFKGDLPADATTSTKGIVMLETATNSTSTTKAATPSAVKTTYDLASTTISIAANAETVANAASAAVGTKIDQSLVTAKGDIIAATGSGAVDNLAVGANNSMLVADSAQATGIKWSSAISPASASVSGSVSAGSLSVSGASQFTGKITVGPIVENVVDVTLVSDTATLDWNAGNIYYIATAPAAAMTFNATNVPTTASSIFSVVVMVVQGATGRIPSTFQIDGSPQTIKWQGGNAPTPTSSAGKTDIFSFSMQRTSGGSWVVYGSATLNF